MNKIVRNWRANPNPKFFFMKKVIFYEKKTGARTIKINE